MEYKFEMPNGIVDFGVDDRASLAASGGIDQSIKVFQEDQRPRRADPVGPWQGGRVVG